MRPVKVVIIVPKIALHELKLRIRSQRLQTTHRSQRQAACQEVRKIIIFGSEFRYSFSHTFSTDSGVKRGDTAALQRNKYRNRIAFLIATKRKSLKRLALKRVPRHASRRMKGKYMASRQTTQNKRNPLRTTRKPYDKKIRRLSVVSFKLNKNYFQGFLNNFCYS